MEVQFMYVCADVLLVSTLIEIDKLTNLTDKTLFFPEIEARDADVHHI